MFTAWLPVKEPVKVGNSGFLGALGSFGTVKFSPYNNLIVSQVEYFGTSDTAVYRIDGLTLTQTKNLFTNENNTMEGVETEYQINGESVSEGAYNIALNAVFTSASFYSVGYGYGHDNTDANRAALKSGEKSFMLVLG